ncbi:MAG: hypothetical protein ACRDF0_02385 [Candidatus Limnocylindria bacterium]
MPDALDTQAVEDTARGLLDARITAVRELAKAQVAVDQARDALAATEASHAAVYAAATRAGWSDGELKQMGLVASKRRAPGRPRRARSGRHRGTPEPVEQPTALGDAGAQLDANEG